MSVEKDLSHHRRSYEKDELTEDTISANPYEQFVNWFEDAAKSGVVEPNAMTLATATSTGKPSIRTVLLKSFSEDGFVFYSNYHSRKGMELDQNNQAALLFYWDVMERQIRIEGTVEKVDVKTSEEYFAARPYESRLSAIVSEQSKEIPNREFLENKMQELRQTGAIKRPENWGGYIIRVNYFEFWQGRPNRLHDRIVYEKNEAQWLIKRIAP